MMLICGLGSKEVIQPPQEKVKIPLHKQWSALIHNRPMLILTICMFVHGIQMNGRLMIATYYCTYVLNSIAALSIFNLLNAISAVIGALIAPTLARKCGNKGVVSAIILYLCAFSMVLQYTTAANLILFYLLVSITGLCYGGFSTLMFSMIPDSVDYAQFKFGVRVDGFLNAVASFGFKVGGAISISATGLLLSFYGYIPNSPQSPECLNTIAILMTLFPAAGCTIAGTLLLFYKINNGKHQEIIRTLKERHAI
ncbi:MAG: MFS transporter [Eubacterium sp.]